MAKWLRFTALLAIAGVLATTGCYAQCIASVCSFRAAQHAAGCHQPAPCKNHGRSACRYTAAAIAEASPHASAGSMLQHPEMANAWSAVPLIVVSSVLTTSRVVSRPESPPGASPLALLSVLRI